MSIIPVTVGLIQENLVCVFERYTLNQHLEAIHFTEHGMDGNIDFAGQLVDLDLRAKSDT